MLSFTIKWISELSNYGRKSFSGTAVRYDEEGKHLSGRTHLVNKFEKRILVWMGKYKRIEDIPRFVSPDTMERARSRMRIRVANIMMVMTAIGCVAMIYSGKQAHKRGESVQQQNLDMHRRYREESIAKEKDKA